jgi:hypothetical protein
MSPEQELQRAEQARQVMETPLVRETLELMEREIVEAWIACPARDTEGRDWLWRQIVSTRKFKDTLRGVMESGKLAQARLKEKQTLAERALNLVRL